MDNLPPPDFEASLWWYIAAPAGTRLELVKKLSDEIVKGIKSGGAAAALGLADRGLLAEGQAADVVLFDPAIIDRSTYDDPHQYPAGIGAVIVNGTIVIDGGEHTGALPGRLLRRRGTVLA